MTAQDRGWGPPGCSREQLVVVPCPGIQLNIRRDIGPLFAELVRWLTVARERDRVPALNSSGGYNKRYISGTTTWSNHSWGLAADFNAGTNPYGWNATEDMPDETTAKAASLGMRWGGDYTGKRDGMHFEFIGTPADAARRVAALRHAAHTLQTPTEDDMPLTNPEIDEIADRVWNRRRTHGTLDDQPPVAVLADIQRLNDKVDALTAAVHALAAK